MDPTSLKILLSGSKKDDSLYVDDVFSTFLYEGNNSTNTITNGIDFAGEGGMLWVKSRNNTSAENHTIVDTERPIKQNESGYPYLNSASLNQEYESGLTSFNSDGFTWGSGNNQYNGSLDYVAWSFRKASGFFDVVTWSGNSTSGRQIPHTLGSVPGMILVKVTNQSDSWVVYHRSKGNQWYAKLDTPDAGWDGTSMWNSTTPTSTHFTVGNGWDINYTGNTYVAYIFAHDDASFGTNEDESIIKCGQFEANPGTAVNLGFEPQWVLVKRIDGSRDWFLIDNMRGMSGSADQNSQTLRANQSDAESDNRNIFLTSTGFTVATSSAFNTDTHIYMAIRRPNKPPEAATEVFDVSWRITGEPTVQTPFVVDASIMASWNGTGASSDQTYHGWFSRLTGKYGLSSTSTNPQYNWGNNSGRFDYMNGWGGSNTASTYTQFYNFKRTPGFFDVVAYTGVQNPANHYVNHNLGVVPELIFFKRRSGYKDWFTYSSVTGTGKVLYLNEDLSVVTDSSFISTTPTSTVIPTNGYYQIDNHGDTYSAFLFATLPGISKVGSYSGTGYDVNVDCGFTAGPRFVMIKRTDSSGDWYVFDTLRGLTAGNDPYMFMNSYIQQVSNTDYIDPLSSGFTITSSAPAALNASGGTYLFLAIA